VVVHAGLEALNSRIKVARKTYTVLMRGVRFDEDENEAFELCALGTKNQKVLRLLACHPIEEVRRAVARNKETPYDTLLCLLKDKRADVVRDVLAFGKLEETDYVALSEKFVRDGSLFAKLDDSKYVRLIKLTGKLASWPKSQSICLLHNKHIGIDGLRAIDLNSFSPFEGDGLELLSDIIKNKMKEIIGKVPFAERQIPPKETLPWNLYFSAEHRGDEPDELPDEEEYKTALESLVRQIT
jgi:hypothetical protein